MTAMPHLLEVRNLAMHFPFHGKVAGDGRRVVRAVDGAYSPAAKLADGCIGYGLLARISHQWLCEGLREPK